MQPRRILITGSEGTIGKVVKKSLKDEGYNLVLLDKEAENPVDLLTDNLTPYFEGVDNVFHLAAHASQFINQEKARENLDMVWRVLEASKNTGVNRIVNASSINVHDYNIMYLRGEKLTEETPIRMNTKVIWTAGEAKPFYAYAKIFGETGVNACHNRYGMHGLNLRFGAVYPEDEPWTDEPDNFAIWLSHHDLGEIAKRAVNFEGLASIVCVSNNSERFVDLAPIQKALGYTPESDSAKYRKS